MGKKLLLLITSKYMASNQVISGTREPRIGEVTGDVPTFVENRVRRAGDGDYAACGLWASAGGREDVRW